MSEHAQKVSTASGDYKAFDDSGSFEDWLFNTKRYFKMHMPTKLQLSRVGDSNLVPSILVEQEDLLVLKVSCLEKGDIKQQLDDYVQTRSAQNKECTLTDLVDTVQKFSVWRH